MLQYNRQLKQEVTVNPLIVSSPLQNKCNGQQFTTKYQREEWFLFSQPSLPPASSALQFPLTKWPYKEQSPAFHLREKCTPGISVSPSSCSAPLLSLSNSTLYMRFIPVRWIPGRKLLSHPEVKEEKLSHLFHRPSAAPRE